MTHTKKDALGQNSDATCSKHPALNINRLRIKPSIMYIFFVPCSSNPDGKWGVDSRMAVNSFLCFCLRGKF